MTAEGAIRLGCFLGVFALVALAERAWPRRVPSVPRGPRWFSNIAIACIDTGVIRLVMPLMPVGMAEIATAKGWGLLNLLPIPPWAGIIGSVLFLDLVIYLQHRAFHRIPLCWRFHRMHHTDLDLDVSSGNRFHPIEILASTVIKLSVVVIIGIAPVAVVIFEVMLNAASLFNHGNIYLPVGLDRWLRLVLVTPDMHRVHHSIIPRETDSNFGFSVPWWDRLLGTYRDQPKAGHDGMIIGLKEYRQPARLGLYGLLMVPFRRPYG